MRIFFLGQLGVPAGTRHGLHAERARRIEALGRLLVHQKHHVSAAATRPFVTGYIRNLQGMRMVLCPSLDPGRPGGLMYILLSLIAAWRFRAQVVHVHGWLAAVVTRLCMFLWPAPALVWTIDGLPRRTGKMLRPLMPPVARGFDAVTVPSRVLQYRLLVEYGIRAAYVPDGYPAEPQPALPLARLRLRPDQYAVAFASDRAAIRDVVAAFHSVPDRPRLVFVPEAASRALAPTAQRRLKRRYHWVTLLDTASERVVATLIRQARAVLVAKPNMPIDVVLLAMDAGKAIAAVAEPRLQETLGVAGRFFKAGDQRALAAAVTEVLQEKGRQHPLGKAARKRARSHFTWQRIVPEYLALYRTRVAAPTVLDSARPALGRLSVATR